MTKASDMTAQNIAPGFRAIRFTREWITRPVFAVVLAVAIIAAIFAGRPYLEIAVAVVVFAGAREWHRMVGGGRYAVEFAATTAAIWGALAAYLLWETSWVPQTILAGGVLLVGLLGLVRRNNPVWNAAGVLYLGLPSLAMLALRDQPHHATWVIVGLFIVVWATDTGALFVGNLAGGRKIAPRLSPNKTWSGTIGGVIAASVLNGAFVVMLGGNMLAGAVFGAGLAVVAHLGDLFESLVKRIFHYKDSGSLIPGHGGVLDRIDSTLFALVAMEIAVFVLHLDPLFGGTP
ncbi:MAG: phosphatidate cytidylyltransferase [Alphaproteobacteria bacterium]|nr:phosphatidate cytidylyltransferase [Alphaproteobacteria bacterium]